MTLITYLAPEGGGMNQLFNMLGEKSPPMPGVPLPGIADDKCITAVKVQTGI